jgi:hypothetical protein
MTPLLNTSRRAWVPFVGVMTGNLEVEDEALLGPATPVNGSYRVPWMTLIRSVWTLLLGFLFRRHRPNPVFDERGKPLVRPEVIT